MRNRRAPKKKQPAELGESVTYGAIEIGRVDQIIVWGYLDIDEQKTIDLFHKRAAKALPPATRYEIRRAIPTNYGKTKGVGWYHHPNMQYASQRDWAQLGEEHGNWNAMGYFLIGRFTTPEASA